MFKIKEIPLILLLCFTLVYSTIGNPDNVIWSGLYFITIHFTLLCLFFNYNNKLIRKIGISLNATVLFYVVLKFFFAIELFRILNLIIFTICFFGIILIEKKNE